MAKIMRYMEKLGLLMWKHFHLRKYHMFLSTFEALLPILSIWFTIYFSQNFTHMEQVKYKNVTARRPWRVSDIAQQSQTFTSIIFTPDHSAVHKLMDQYRRYLRGRKLTITLFILKNSFLIFCILIFFA